MMRGAIIQAVLVALAIPELSGCRGREGSPRGPVAAAAVAPPELHVPGARLNGVRPNGLATNGCNHDGVPLSELPGNPLSSDTLQHNQAVFDSLCDPAAQGFIQGLVECALTEKDVLTVKLDDGTMLTFQGDIAMAPAWSTGPCDADCQEWVTSCIVSRINYYGVHVRISMRADGGPQSVRTDEQERARFPIQEGAFYGNLFAFPSVAYSCSGRDHDPFYEVVRRCAQAASDCGYIRRLGACSDYDGPADSSTVRFACEGTTTDGAFRNCHSKTTNVMGQFDPPGAIYKHPVTIFTLHARFVPDDGC
jgi:hypothetical protein